MDGAMDGELGVGTVRPALVCEGLALNDLPICSCNATVAYRKSRLMDSCQARRGGRALSLQSSASVNWWGYTYLIVNVFLRSNTRLHASRLGRYMSREKLQVPGDWVPKYVVIYPFRMHSVH